MTFSQFDVVEFHWGRPLCRHIFLVIAFDVRNNPAPFALQSTWVTTQVNEFQVWNIGFQFCTATSPTACPIISFKYLFSVQASYRQLPLGGLSDASFENCLFKASSRTRHCMARFCKTVRANEFRLDLHECRVKWNQKQGSLSLRHLLIHRCCIPLGQVRV